MTIVYIEVKPFKLGNRELAKAYDTLKRQRKIKGAENQNLTKFTQKAQYIKQNHRYIPLRIQEDKLQALVDRAHLTESDIRAARGKTSRDITALERDLEENEALTEYKYPTLPLIPTGNVVESIKQTISMMDGKQENLFENSFQAGGVDNIDISMATPIDPDEFETEPETPVRGRAQTTLGLLGSNFASRLAEVSTIADESINTSEKQEPEPKKVFMADQSDKAKQIKMDGTASIPIWHKTGSDDLDNLRNYVRDMRRAKELKILANDSMLINASLVKSGRTKLYAEIPKEAESSVTEFVKYLQTAYGMSKIERIKELHKIKQEQNENPHSYLSRVINSYYEAKGTGKKTIEDIKKHETEPDEIIAIYLKGLRNPQVRIQVKSRLDELELDKIAKVTKNIETAMKDSDDRQTVNQIDEVNDKLNVLAINGKFKMKRRSDNPNWRNKSNKYQAPKRWPTTRSAIGGTKIKCYKCGRLGHVANNCRVGKSYGTQNKQYNNAAGQKKPLKCFKCQKFGHYARNCRSTGNKFKSR